MKKLLVVVLSIFLSVNLTVLVLGANVDEIIGYVMDIHDDIVHVVGEPFADDGLQGALVRIGEAPVYDLRTGLRVPAQSIRKDMDIRIAYNVQQTSDPFPAVVVWLNWDDDDAAVFTVEVSENITHGNEGFVFLSADGKYRVVLTPETTILDHNNKNLPVSEITSGMEFFVWVDMITASTPALVYPEKVVVVRRNQLWK